MTSLGKAIKLCKIDQASAPRSQSARIQDPQHMICFRSNGRDNTGREAHPNTLYTKSAGCHSAADRVNTENELRPQYAPYINMGGIRGQHSNNMNSQNASTCARQMSNSQSRSGNYVQFNTKTNVATCSYNNYDRGVAGMGQQHTANASKGACGGSQTVEGFVHHPKESTRNNSAANASYRSCKFTQMSGM